VREERLRIESRMASDGGPSAMCIWVTQVREWMEGDEEGILDLRSDLERSLRFDMERLHQESLLQRDWGCDVRDIMGALRTLD
jgi:hypothetical protein